MKCSNCNVEIDDNSNYCSNCGCILKDLKKESLTLDKIYRKYNFRKTFGFVLFLVGLFIPIIIRVFLLMLLLTLCIMLLGFHMIEIGTTNILMFPVIYSIQSGNLGNIVFAFVFLILPWIISAIGFVMWRKNKKKMKEYEKLWGVIN